MGTPADPLGWAMIGASALQGGMSILGGFQQREAMKGQAMAKEYEARMARLQGKQANVNRLDELNQALGAIDVIRAGRGVNIDSATGAAIRQDRRERARNAINNEVLGYRLDAMSRENEARGLRRSGRWAVVSGFGSALNSFRQAAGDYRSMRGS